MAETLPHDATLTAMPPDTLEPVPSPPHDAEAKRAAFQKQHGQKHEEGTKDQVSGDEEKTEKTEVGKVTEKTSAEKGEDNRPGPSSESKVEKSKVATKPTPNADFTESDAEARFVPN